MVPIRPVRPQNWQNALFAHPLPLHSLDYAHLTSNWARFFNALTQPNSNRVEDWRGLLRLNPQPPQQGTGNGIMSREEVEYDRLSEEWQCFWATLRPNANLRSIGIIVRYAHAASWGVAQAIRNELLNNRNEQEIIGWGLAV